MTEKAKRAKQKWFVDRISTEACPHHLSAIADNDGYLFDIKPLASGDECLVIWWQWK